MPFIKTHIHFVWSTKNHAPLLNTKETRLQFWNHIKENSLKKGIFIDHINGFSNHCHCLISLGADQTMSNIMKLLKGESSYWINKNKLCRKRFEWQDEYFAISISESNVQIVRNYIMNQEQHHRVRTFEEEYEEFIRRYGFG